MTHINNFSRGTIPKAGKSNEYASSTSKEKNFKNLNFRARKWPIQVEFLTKNCRFCFEKYENCNFWPKSRYLT